MIHRWVMKYYEITMVDRWNSIGTNPGADFLSWKNFREEYSSERMAARLANL